jgi:hypothetical protein
MGGDGDMGMIFGDHDSDHSIIAEGRCQKKRIVTTMVDDTHWQGRSSKR